MSGKETKARLILASASPRRHELLQQLGVEFEIIVADIEEIPTPGEQPGEFVLRMAREKALEVLRREQRGLPVLGSDTAVILDGTTLSQESSAEKVATLARINDAREGSL